MNTNQKLSLINSVYRYGGTVKIMIIGLGSVGSYFLDYLLSMNNKQIEVIVVGRDKLQMTQDVNIIKTAATIRGLCMNKITIDSCDLDNVSSIETVLNTHRPHIILNASRVYAGLKYGSISWNTIRAYGIWVPLSVKFIYNIMKAYQQSGSNAIVINTSYSDAVNPWLKSAGCAYPDFGSGNLNHLVPRIKFAVAKIMNVDDFWNIDVTIATSHFHDVVISKEGHTENINPLLDVRYHSRELKIDHNLIYANCAISMPSDQKRNMMVASSVFDIVNSIFTSIMTNSVQKIHIPGYDGEIGGYPCMLETHETTTNSHIDVTHFTVEEMREANKKSIYLDGIQCIENGFLYYTDELIKKVNDNFNVFLPKYFHLNEANEIAELLIKDLIIPSTNS